MYSPKKELAKGLLVVIPITAVLFLFIYGFIIWSGRVSLTAWEGILPNMELVGFSNYLALFKSLRFQTDLFNTLFFTLFFIIITISIGFVLSYLLFSGLRFESFFRTVYLFPLALSFVVTGVLWRWIFSPEMGINVLLNMVGFKEFSFGWFTSTESIGKFNVALIPIIIAASWQYCGYTMAMFLAGLKSIPEQILESAKIDGAGEWRIVHSILIPSLRPIIFSAIIVLGHVSLKIFDLAYTMTGKGPMFVTDFPGLFMFETTFRGNYYAEGSAIAIVMLTLVATVIVPYLISVFRGDET